MLALPPIPWCESGDRTHSRKRHPQRVAPLAFVTALACVGAMTGAPCASAIIAGGKIVGTVKHEAMPVAGVHVEVFDSETHALAASAVTESEGKYEVSSAPGKYKVEFVPPAGSKLIPQYYEGQTSWGNATVVQVETGELKEANAILHLGGVIKGAVTNTEGQPLEGLEVTAIPADRDEFYVSVAVETGAGGSYEIKELPKGRYIVRFSPSEGANYVAQYYSGQSLFEKATEIAVIEEGTTPEISAKLSVGGIIRGTVIDASSGRPVDHAGVFAINAGAQAFAFAETNATGEYTIVGLPSGSYFVEFEAPFTEHEPEYLAQTREGVGVVQGSTTGVSAALVPSRPINTMAPVASGVPLVGQTLSCSRGTWTGLTPLGFSYKWLRDGLPIASGNTYAVQTADEGHGLACEVQAENSVGRASAKSNTLTVPVQALSPLSPPALPPPPPPPPTSAPALLKPAHVNESDGEITLEWEFPEDGEAEYFAEVTEGASIARFEADLGVSGPLEQLRIESLAMAATNAKCKRGFVRKGDRCVSNKPVVFTRKLFSVPTAGKYEVKIKPTGKVLGALEHGKSLSIKVTLRFVPSGTTVHIVKVNTVKDRIKPKHK